MAVMDSALQPSVSNRRRRVRHKIQTPAYATFTAASKGAMLDLHEIVNISEDGVAIQCHSPLEVKTKVELCLDLADCAEHIYTTGQVVWSNASGRAGLRFSQLSAQSLARLREWLFVNVMSGVAHGEVDVELATLRRDDAPPRPNYSDTLAAVGAVRRQVEALGVDLDSALQFVAERTQKLVRASGVAIAMADTDPDFMVCRASSGPDAPPVGARLQVGSGFSGECVKTGRLLRCDDTEADPRVDRENCRALGIRSMVAAPLRDAEKVIGILDVFSAQPDVFSEADGKALQHLADTIAAAFHRAQPAENESALKTEKAPLQFPPAPGSVLFASPSEEEKVPAFHAEKVSLGPSLPQSHLIILICAAAAIFLVLGYNLAPLIQSKLEERSRNPIPTVLASSQPPKSESSPVPSASSFETSNYSQLRTMAVNGDPIAENALGLRYFQGDDKNGITRDEKQAFYWLSRAADHGNLAAQAKLGFLFWGGRGVPKDLNRAYFWTVLARARGDEENKDLATVLAAGMTRRQAAAIEHEADLWLQQNMAKKPLPGR